MAIEQLTAGSELIPDFLGLPRRLYAGDRRWIPDDGAHLRTQLLAAVAGGRARCAHFVGRIRGRVAARVSAFANEALADDDGARVGALGHFEAEDDTALVRDLVAHALEWLRETHGITRAWGPLNGDIWHGYRCMTHGFDSEPFAGEPYNKPYYPSALEESGAAVRFAWNSFEGGGLEQARHVLERGEEQMQRVLARGYRFRAVDLEHLDREVTTLHGLVCQAFARFPAFTPIGAHEFRELTLPMAPAIVPGGSCFLHDPAGRCVGFAVALLDLADTARSGGRTGPPVTSCGPGRGPPESRRILFQFIGVTPEAARLCPGLGRALVTYVLGRLMAAGYERYVASLISRGNSSRGLVGATQALDERRYVLYEWRS